ncbi:MULTISPECIES: SRPBCC family protein [Actinomycetes]|uniref:SRPBCC family protein n=1 Tax=Actinomycetes TaxID=1760 RepID=UPI0003D2E2F6|nr:MULTISPECIES: SRPBCC family protein [Actinomycetes]ETD33518.1 polyketide cyclase [Williamsia sp. D3]
MAQVTASQSTVINAAPEKVLAALSDYQTVRPSILPGQYRDYKVVEGGVGAGTVASWTLQATKKRSRNVQARVGVVGSTVTETDVNSSMVTTYQVDASGASSKVTTTTTWQGAGGIGGFFEKTFAPKGLAKIQAELLGNLKSHVERV